MDPRRLAPFALLGALSASGCSVTASHAVRRFDDRRAPRTEPCSAPEILADRGGTRPRQSLAVISAQCTPSRPEDCRRELQAGACSVQADALIEVTDRVQRRMRRMVGLAVAWTDDAPAAP